MEELGTSKLTRMTALSKSSEQLDQLWKHSAGPRGSDRDKRNASFFAHVREAQGQERWQRERYLSNQAEKDPEIIGPQNTPGQMHDDTQKQNSGTMMGSGEEAGPLTTAGKKTSSRSTTPTSQTSSRAQVPSASSGSYSLITDEFRSTETSSDPPPASERDSTSSTPTQIKLPCENRQSSR